MRRKQACVGGGFWCNFRHFLRRTYCSAELPTIHSSPRNQEGGGGAKPIHRSRGGTWGLSKNGVQREQTVYGDIS